VLEIVPGDGQSVERLRKLALSDDLLDFWSEPSGAGEKVRVMVPPERVAPTLHWLENNGIPYTTRTHNMQEVMDPVWKKIDAINAGGKRRALVLDDFNNLEQIYAWLQTEVSLCREGLTCRVVNLGNSILNHPIYSFQISKDTGTQRRAYYVDATTHAREWLSTTTALNVLDALATGSSPEAVRLADTFDWHIVPIVNPDGYAFTWDGDRYWKKNRRTHGACHGTDLNRNFATTWGTEGVSHTPCSDMFCGVTAASEPETRAIQNEIRRIAPTLRGLFTLHSYNQTWKFPWARTVNHEGLVCERSSDHNELMRVANAAANAAQATYNTVWTRGNFCELYGPASGTTDSYAKSGAGVTYTFILDTRGEDFVVDKDEIVPSFNEFWNGLVASVDAIN
jgi:carboxypeptidase A2